nr:phosphate ABC transporter permease subunit PstC [Clostridium sp. Cult3]
MTSIIAVLGITIFIFFKGIPAIQEIGLKQFLLGQEWQPTGGSFGLLPMIVGSIYVTLGSLVLGAPIGVLTAIFISEIASKRISSLYRGLVELLAGIPSVVYGFFGLATIVPTIDRILGGGGNSLLAASIILGIMILPTIISISETAIKSVPTELKEGSLALGASDIYTIFKVTIPAARSGILTSLVLAIGRAIGETMAVILVAGNTPLVPKAIEDRVRTLTGNIALEMGYAHGLHQQALFATGVILFMFIIALNLLLIIFNKKVGGDR